MQIRIQKEREDSEGEEMGGQPMEMFLLKMEPQIPEEGAVEYIPSMELLGLMADQEL
jgi:hypothetical protein